MPTLIQIVKQNGNDTVCGRIFDLTIQVLIIVSLIMFSVEMLPKLSTATHGFLQTVHFNAAVFYEFTDALGF
ncbi:hypothetical protein [Fuerstiella marisgermanici]|uniref:Uncharacterized protein n=1 Tax=Fuerstiella marisgermanici TaxID=1891926 RepID=A0A1P8WAN3_9PLAN|nr:hypothetical protein [Fuerstiella marisgermanici]APZ91128.1 hypothetical protein Fuma_00714 [Fuerstiella marisgermanici]